MGRILNLGLDLFCFTHHNIDFNDMLNWLEFMLFNFIKQALPNSSYAHKQPKTNIKASSLT